MMSILLTALVLPAIFIAVQWIVSDHTRSVSGMREEKSQRWREIEPSVRHQSETRKTLEISKWLKRSDSIIELIATLMTMFVFLLTLHNFLSGQIQMIIGEIFITGMALFLAISWRYMRSRNKLKSLISEIEIEIPSVIVMFSLLVSAGESLRGAIEYLSHFPKSKISKIFRDINVYHQHGLSITQLLDSAAEESHSRSFRKFTDALALSIDRGSPLSAVLANQTFESRSAYKAELLKVAGKAELKLMIPIVFLILPISIVFALLPSLKALSNVM
jgi:tight adherence protein C